MSVEIECLASIGLAAWAYDLLSTDVETQCLVSISDAEDRWHRRNQEIASIWSPAAMAGAQLSLYQNQAAANAYGLGLFGGALSIQGPLQSLGLAI